MQSFWFKDRLSSALLALLIQTGLIGLLIFSFEAAQRPQQEQESILYLSRPPIRKVKPAVTIIDARGAPPNRKRSAKPSALPLFVQPDTTSTAISPTAVAPSSPEALNSLGHALFDCAPEKLAKLSPDERAHCLPSLEGLAKPNGSDVTTSPYQAKNEAEWNDEMARKSAPVGPPGGTLWGAVETLLFNPSAFADKRNYTYASPAPPQLSGADALYQAIHSTPDCPAMSDHEKKVCEDAVAALGGGNQRFAAAAPSPPKVHASEAQFQAALNAYHQRRGTSPLIAAAQKPQ
jgi:hypothetical protein